jgi:hypothetical protein
MAKGDGNGDGQQRWQLQWPMVTETAMADGEGNGNGDGWQQCNRDGGSNGSQKPQWQWLMAMVMGNGYGNGDGDRVGDGNGNGNHNGNRHARATMTKRGLPPHVPAMCSTVAGVTPCLHPHGHKGKGIHQRCVMGVTLLKVFAPSFQGEGILTAHHWFFFLFIIYNYCSVYWTTLCFPLAIFRCSRTLSAHWRSTSSTPPRTPSAYWRSTPASIALFVKVSPGSLSWCEMTNLSATFFFSQTFALSLTDNTFVIWKHPVVIVETFKVKVYLGFKAFSCTTLLPSLGACIC